MGLDPEVDLEWTWSRRAQEKLAWLIDAEQEIVIHFETIASIASSTAAFSTKHRAANC